MVPVPCVTLKDAKAESGISSPTSDLKVKFFSWVSVFRSSSWSWRVTSTSRSPAWYRGRFVPRSWNPIVRPTVWVDIPYFLACSRSILTWTSLPARSKSVSTLTTDGIS